MTCRAHWQCQVYTLFPKRNATLISRFFMVTLDQGQWPQVMCTKGNAPGSNPRFYDIHSSPKERHLSISLEATSFVKLQLWLVLRYPLTMREWWGILEWGFWQIVTGCNAQMKFGPKFTDLHSSPKERQLKKSCVSFGEECSECAGMSKILQVGVTSTRQLHQL